MYIERKPRIFIGSSTEGLDVARCMQQELEFEAESPLWNQNVFVPRLSFLESLARQASTFEFALLVTIAEDSIESRGIQSLAPRDNIMFELGLFIGTLGRERSFILCNRDKRPKLPSDLAGVFELTFADRSDGNLSTSLGPPCQTIREQIARLGLKEEKRLAILSSTTKVVESIGEKAYEMLKLLPALGKMKLNSYPNNLGLSLTQVF